MTPGDALDPLLGLPLSEARRRIALLGLPEPAVQQAVPPRARHPFPPDEAWRVLRAGPGPVLVVGPPIGPPTTAHAD